MADCTVCVNFVLKQEDSTLSGRISNDPNDSGGKTRFGISQYWHPELTAQGFYDTLPTAQALGIAQGVYSSSYCIPLMLAQIEDQDIANALMSFCVNAGTHTGVTAIQKSVNGVQDGKMGPITLDEINTKPKSVVLSNFFQAQSQYYNAIVARNPKNAVFLAGWINRAKENCLLT